MMRVAVIGYGTAGRDVVDGIMSGRAGDCQVVAVLVRDRRKYAAIGERRGVFVTDSERDFFARTPDVVVETAGHDAVRQYGKTTLVNGSDFMVVSVGAFCDLDLQVELESAARASGTQIIVPSAAVAGLDRIASAAQGSLDIVSLTTRKPVEAWRGTYAEQVIDLDEVSEPVIVYEGNARESARLFPESVNVSAALSLAGLGFEKTRVRVVVDPNIDKNVHEVMAEGRFGSLRVEVRNTPSPDNPKTGYIVAMSVCKVLKGMTAPLQIGL